MKKVRNLLTNQLVQLKVLGSLLKIQTVGRLWTALGQNQACVAVAVADCNQTVHEPFAESGNDAGHNIHDVSDFHEIYDNQEFHETHEIHDMHENRDICEIDNIGPDSPSCSKEMGILICAKSLQNNAVLNEENPVYLGKYLVPLSRRRRPSSLNSIDLEKKNIVTVDVHNSNI